ncbi:hypothetical protein, partial [Pectobacterium polaris]|uniref:hypothetical protein n=1 Tax=Pectobacterium polaris TaxID=2042057 RepID=UPI0020C115FB
KACVLPENPASYRDVRTESYLFNKAIDRLKTSDIGQILFIPPQTGAYQAFKSIGITMSCKYKSLIITRQYLEHQYIE